MPQVGIQPPSAYNYYSLVPNIFITPEMFGAQGGGVVDDSPAINAAIQAASAGGGEKGEVRFLSRRVYGCGSTIYCYPDVSLRGGGQVNRSVLRLLNGANCDLLRNLSYGGAGSDRGIQIEDIQLSGNSAGQGAASKGIAFSAVNFLKVKNIFV